MLVYVFTATTYRGIPKNCQIHIFLEISFLVSLRKKKAFYRSFWPNSWYKTTLKSELFLKSLPEKASTLTLDHYRRH